MMQSLDLEEENIFKNIRNLLRLPLQVQIRNRKQKIEQNRKSTKAYKDRILRYFQDLHEHKEEESYYKPVIVSNFWSNIWSNIEYESNSDRNKILSVEEYLIKTRPYLKDIINNLKKSDTCKIQLKISNSFISSIDNDEECIMHSKGDNMEIMINNEADEVIKELFDSLKNIYQNNLESMKGREFVIVIFIYCISNVIKQIGILMDHIEILLVG